MNTNRLILRCLPLILLFAGNAAFSDDKVSPTEVKGTQSVDAQKAKSLFDRGVLFVDVRNSKDWDAGRIPGAEHIDLNGKLSEETLTKVAKKDQELVMYCNGPKCMRSSEASEKAVAWGYSKVYYFRDGFPAWQGAGFPVE